jgi:hypothetical protein
MAEGLPGLGMTEGLVFIHAYALRGVSSVQG